MKSVMRALATALASSVLVACQSIGPPQVVRDRFDYAEAISRSWKDNMLLNLVKLRYGDAPLFLDVSSVVEQYTLQGTVAGAWVFPVPAPIPRMWAVPCNGPTARPSPISR
jgi:hypothetical protein